MHVPSPRIGVLDDKTLEFWWCFFFHPWDAKRWDECDLAGFFTDIILSKQVSQFITHFFKKQLLADKLRMSGGKKKHWLDSF